MEEKNKVPMLLEFLFGEVAETAQRGSSERLIRWAEAFDDWLEVRRTRFGSNIGKDSHRAWAEFLAFTRKAPRDIRVEEVEDYVTPVQGSKVILGQNSNFLATG